MILSATILDDATEDLGRLHAALRRGIPRVRASQTTMPTRDEVGLAKTRAASPRRVAPLPGFRWVS
jgi:hypothetical protein